MYIHVYTYNYEHIVLPQIDEYYTFTHGIFTFTQRHLTYIHILNLTNVYKSILTYMYSFITYTQPFVYTNMIIFIYTYIYKYIYIYIYIYIYTYIYIYI